jgi:hypothetical protein
MKSTERSKHVLLGSILAHPRIVLAICLLGTAVFGWQARHFTIDASADTLLLQNDRNYIQTELVNHRFSPQEFLLIAYKPKNQPLFSEQTFKNLRAISAALRRLDRVESVRSILNVPLFTRIRGDSALLKDLTGPTLESHKYSSSQLEKAFRWHPLYEDLLINRDQTATALQVLFRSNRELDEIKTRIITIQGKSLHGSLSDGEERELADLKRQANPIEKRLNQIRTGEIDKIRNILKEYQGDADLYMGGEHVLIHQLIRIIKNDLIVFGGAIAVVISLVLLLLFRRIRWVAISVACCGCSTLATVGLFGMLGLKTTVISANFIVLQLILTLAIVIHLIVQYREYIITYPHWQQAQLVQETLFRKAGPCFYAGITTSVGFASLLFSNIQPVITFGWMMIIAMSFSLIFSLVLFPAIMVQCRREREVKSWQIIDHLLSFLSNLTLKHQLLIILAGVIVFAGSVGGMIRLDVENSFINYFRERTRVHRELTFIDSEFGGSTPLDIVYTIPSAEHKKDLVLTADTVQLLQRVQHALQQHKAMGKILSVVNFTELAKAMNDDKPLTEYELTAIYWLLDKSLREQLLGAFFDPSHAQVRFSIRIKDSTKGLDRAELMKAIDNAMKKAGIPEDRYTLSNFFVLYQDILQRLFRSQILTLGIVYLVLTLTFVIIFRSIRVALIGIIPNVLTTLAVLGMMGLLKIPLDLMTITIASIAMGIAVDDSIHYIHRYLEELENSTSNEAIKLSHASVGYAVVYTSLIITLGFSLLAFSDFVPSVLFGLLTCFAMVAALIFDLSLLPVMLNRYVRNS